ncbi:MFS general substrate transporter [Testicularia cyperi]|uniref:MFS general substrate transporter n=1 Tax=Testicularia cyperi TaxID=1882483 RepID=A0A317XSY2_9BASI|nr:MFS general substrate transporter [Testicularia cyperi]
MSSASPSWTSSTLRSSPSSTLSLGHASNADKAEDAAKDPEYPDDGTGLSEERSSPRLSKTHSQQIGIYPSEPPQACAIKTPPPAHIDLEGSPKQAETPMHDVREYSSMTTQTTPSKESLEQVTEQSDESTPPPAPQHGRLLPIGKFLVVYACMSLAVLLTSLDQTVVASILPSISNKFGHAQAPWVGTAYLLAQTTFSPLYGKMSDVFGRKALFLTAMLFFLSGVAMCGSASTITTLIVGRGISGIGGAGLFTMVHICISDIVTLRKRGTYHGILSAINGAGAAIGPTVGGIFATQGAEGWRWAFYFQLPIGAVAGLATLLFLPKIGKADRRLLTAKVKALDYVGMLLFVGGNLMVLLSLNLVKPPTKPFVSPHILSIFFAGLAILALFFVWEARYAQEPIVPVAIFKRVSVDLVFVLNMSFGYVFFATLFYVPEFFQVVEGQNALKASISLLPVVIGSIFFSWLTGLLASCTGRYKWSLVVSALLQTVGSILLYYIFRPHMSQALGIVTMTILGVSFGCHMQCSLVACQSATTQDEVAMATSVRNFFRNTGGVLGLAISGCVLHASLPTNLDASLSRYLPVEMLVDVAEKPLLINTLPHPFTTPASEAYVKSLNIVFLIFVPLSAVALLSALVLPEYRLERDQDGKPVRRGLHRYNPASLLVRSRGQPQASEALEKA